MALIYEADHEVPWDLDAPDYDFWDGLTETNLSTMRQLAAAAWPERGRYGLRCVVDSDGDLAAVDKTINYSLPAGAWFMVGFWIYQTAAPLSGKFHNILGVKASTSKLDFYSTITNTSLIRFRTKADSGVIQGGTLYDRLTEGRWHYLVFGLKRATTNVAADGVHRFYIDGELVEEVTSIDNFDRYATIATVDLGGFTAGNSKTSTIDYDEFVIADAYPEPYARPPPTDLLCPERIAVLWRVASSDSRTFADYCVAELGIPRANLVALPNASADESLADYATFQSEVETDVAAYLALCPELAARLMCFVIGHGVPGYFTSGGVLHSAASRLMNYGTAFASQTDNPLYRGLTNECQSTTRLTRAALGGRYLAVRVDAGTIGYSQAIIDRGVTATEAAIDADEYVYTDETAYRSSADAALLGLELAEIPTSPDQFSGDAFVFGDTASVTFTTPAGSRVAFVDDSAASADTLRNNTNVCCNAVHYGHGAYPAGCYAAALGTSETADGFSIDAFLEMLRAGGTFPEAVAVAVEHLDYTAVAVGSPLLAAVLPGEWTQLAEIDDGGAARYSWRSAQLADSAVHGFRIVPVDAAGNEGVATEVDVLVVRPPDPPEVEYSFDDGTSKVTVSEA